MARTNIRLDAARRAYREALDSARASPSSESWARLLAAGKELSSAQEPKPRSPRRGRRGATPTYHDLESSPVEAESPELELE